MRAGGRASRGLPTHRQRPDTVFGVIFVTLEDETGWANVVVRSRVAGRYRCPFPGVRLLGVEGVVEREGEVVHLVACQHRPQMSAFHRFEMSGFQRFLRG